MLGKSHTLSLTLSLALLAGVSTQALAGGDWPAGGYGGIKDYGTYEAVPVPAPTPVPQYEPKWYLRADIGWRFDTSANLEGANSGLRDDEDLEGQGIFSFGMGRYITPTLRFDVTGEIRAHQVIERDRITTVGDLVEQSERDTDVLVTNPDGSTTTFTRLTINRHVYDIERDYKTDLGSYMVMANLYKDFDTGWGFKPYIGAGIGFVVHSMNRDYRENAECAFTRREYTWPDSVTQINQLPDCVFNSDTEYERAYETERGQSTTGVGLGLALMTGFGYEVYDGIHWDMGYRYVYQDGSIAIVDNVLGGNDESVVRLEGRHDHEIRTGFRFDIQ